MGTGNGFGKQFLSGIGRWSINVSFKMVTCGNKNLPEASFLNVIMTDQFRNDRNATFPFRDEGMGQND